MEIDEREVLDITVDWLLTLLEENNPVYNEKMENIGTIQELKDHTFKEFLSWKTGITFIEDETYYDLYLERVQEYVLDLLAEEGKDEEALMDIDPQTYILHGYDTNTIEEISNL